MCRTLRVKTAPLAAVIMQCLDFTEIILSVVFSVRVYLIWCVCVLSAVIEMHQCQRFGKSVQHQHQQEAVPARCAAAVARSGLLPDIL